MPSASTASVIPIQPFDSPPMQSLTGPIASRVTIAARKKRREALNSLWYSMLQISDGGATLAGVGKDRMSAPTYVLSAGLMDIHQIRR